MRRSNTWCSINDWRRSALKLDKTHKELSWRDGYPISGDVQPFGAPERSTTKPCGDLSACSDRHVEGIAKTFARNLTLPPISIAQAHSLPKLDQCTEFVRASRSLSFVRRFLVHDKEVNGDESSEISDEATSSKEESVYSDCCATFEFRFIPHSLPSEEPTTDSWITRSFSSGSSWKYQLLEKMSSSQSLSTLV
uniref:Uncharacterized protein n=1 Tax=Ascaris lumbricoides TaxID=6252 RepID=A0A0M3HY08_ASCLU